VLPQLREGNTPVGSGRSAASQTAAGEGFSRRHERGETVQEGSITYRVASVEARQPIGEALPSENRDEGEGRRRRRGEEREEDCSNPVLLARPLDESLSELVKVQRSQTEAEA
jgi:hypothetical protein